VIGSLSTWDEIEFNQGRGMRSYAVDMMDAVDRPIDGC
jgi:hypothetical protein